MKLERTGRVHFTRKAWRLISVAHGLGGRTVAWCVAAVIVVSPWGWKPVVRWVPA